MTFQPVVPLSGIAGWRFLEATLPAQREAFDKSAQLQRNVTYYQENISSITSAEQLVNDRVLLEVSLGAFGLEDEINKKAFVQKILEEGTDNPDSIANRLVDPKYREFSAALGFGNILGARVAQSDFASNIVSNYLERSFEVAIGNVDEDMRLALNFKRQIETYANSPSPTETAWFQILGDVPVRKVFEVALNLPSEIGSLDIDLQKEFISERAADLFGSASVAVFRDPENVETLMNRFLGFSEINSGPSNFTPGVAALTLLQGSSIGPSATIQGLVLSNFS
jgi:hypothetical protein